MQNTPSQVAQSPKNGSYKVEMLFSRIISLVGWFALIVSATRIVMYLQDNRLTFDDAIADAFIQGLLILSFIGVFLIVTGKAARASFKTASYSREILERLVRSDASDELD